MPTKITASGIIRNSETPRVGVTSKASPEFIDDCITQGIDLGYEDALQDAMARLRQESPNTVDSASYEDALEVEAQRELECFDSSGPYLYGDWKKIDLSSIAGKQGQGYEIDRNGSHGFACSYSNGSFGNCVSVEWSRTTKACHHTSPCFVMADGSGPCGDLDTAGDSVVAYCLPDDCMQSAEDEVIEK